MFVIAHDGTVGGLSVGKLTGYRNESGLLNSELSQAEIGNDPLGNLAGDINIFYDPAANPQANVEDLVTSGQITAGESGDVYSWTAGFGSGLGTGRKAVANAATDTFFGLVTLGGDWNPLREEVTDDDRANGYDAAYLFSRGGTELLTALGTGGLATVASKGGKAAQLGGAALAGKLADWAGRADETVS